MIYEFKHSPHTINSYFCYHPHFTDVEIEVQRDEMPWVRS